MSCQRVGSLKVIAFVLCLTTFCISEGHCFCPVSEKTFCISEGHCFCPVSEKTFCISEGHCFCLVSEKTFCISEGHCVCPVSEKTFCISEGRLADQKAGPSNLQNIIVFQMTSHISVISLTSNMSSKALPCPQRPFDYPSVVS